MDKIRLLKGFHTQLEKLKEEAGLLKLEYTRKQADYQSKLNQIIEVEKKMKHLNSDKKPKVSEHAILRYLQRVEGLDIEEVTKKILTPDVIGMVDLLGGDGKYPLTKDKSEYRAIISNYTVTTVTGGDMDNEK